jgi:hypothetical protein
MNGRCTQRGCAVRWRDGGDRPCRDHIEDELTPQQRMNMLREVMQLAPGERGSSDQPGAA